MPLPSPRLLLLAALLGPLAAAPARAAEPAAAPKATVPAKASQAIVGEWRILGPASQAHVAQMIRLTLADQEPGIEEFQAARLDGEQAAQVVEGRARVRNEPDSTAVKALREDWAHLDGARATIGDKLMELRFGKTAEHLSYTIESEEGIRMLAAVTSSEGTDEMLLTLVDQNTLMFGPLGGEPTVLYRLGAP